MEDDGYANVYVCRDRKIDVPYVDALTSVFKAPSGGQSSDSVNALIVALDLLIKRTKDLKYNKTIVLITHASSAHFGDPDLLECTKQLEATDTQLSVTLVGDAGNPGPWQALTCSSPKVGLVTIPELLQQTRLYVKPVEQRAKVRLPLVLSPDMEIPVGIYSRTTRVSFPQLKKQSKMAAAIPEDSRKTDKVIMDRTYYATDDKEGEEVKKEDRVKGFKYGQNIVPMSEYDEAALAYSCERTLTTLGFAAAASISPESSMHTVDTLAADKGDPWAHYAFESLVEAMLAEQRVLIARYVYRKDSQPHMVALIPKKGAESASHMVIQFLPFEEDVRPWTCASLPEPTSDQRAAMSKIVDGLTLTAGNEMLRPEETSNPSLARFYDFLASRAVTPGAALKPAPSELSDTILAPPASAVAQLDKVFPENDRGQLKTLFGLEKVEKAVGKGGAKRFWREAIAEKSKNSAAFVGEVDTKKIKVDAFTGAKKNEKKDEDEDALRKVKAEDSQGEGAGGMAVAVGPPPRVHIGSVHPERDFERWLSERRTGGADVVGPAIEQMCDVILRFAEEGEEFHGKALSCMATLRRGCVREGEAASYNEFARKVRLRMTKRLALLWERVVKDGGLGLITDTEVVTSTVTAADAKAFLEGSDVATASAVGLSATATAQQGVPPTALSEKELEAMIE
ncbi:ku80 [Symbiodinium microadriaticum]|nr:ku80 [Symbiodinium sp. KB8]CAE7781692.1 ku80 [Symbiodinium microadriaticum]